MQLLLKNSHNAGYTTNDVVAIVPDDHEWGSGELQTNVFTIVENVTLSEDEMDILRTEDVQIELPKAMLRLTSLRFKLMRDFTLQKRIKRRRYYYDNGIKRKY
jgi:hypothetical protein